MTLADAFARTLGWRSGARARTLGAGMEDEAILAGLESDPDAFAVFYRRHVVALLDHFLARTHDQRLAADLCAETFAAALEDADRFESRRGRADDWLFAIARRLLDDAWRRGTVEGRARRRLGLPPLEPGDRFIGDLEEELVAAARFRASRRIGLPRVPLRAAFAAAAALALVAVGTALALDSGNGGDGAVRRATGCARTVAPDLLARVAALRNGPSGEDRLPPAATSVLQHWKLDQVVEDRARFWGGDGDVGFWVVPVVPRGEAACEPATAACVVAVASGGRADAECVLEEERRGDAWRLAPLLEGHAAIYGIVPDSVRGVRVTLKGQTAQVAARDNVVGGVLPFGYHAMARVAYVRGQSASKPFVGVVDAGGESGAAVRRLRAAGYRTTGRIVAGTPLQASVVYWWPGRASAEDAFGVARLLKVGEVAAVEDTAHTPHPVLDTTAPVVVVAGG